MSRGNLKKKEKENDDGFFLRTLARDLQSPAFVENQYNLWKHDIIWSRFMLIHWSSRPYLCNEKEFFFHADNCSW